MIIGAIKNTIQTGVYETLTQFRQANTFLSAMPGSSMGERVANFIKINRDHLFMGFWVLAQATLLLSRLVQLVGVAGGLTNRAARPMTVFLAMTFVYFMAINGPIVNPKYRIPAEPALIIFLAMGMQWIIYWIAARRVRESGRVSGD